MNITRIPDEAEVQAAVQKEPRTDWSPVYAALAEHGRVVLDEMPKGIRTALSSHYSNTKYKVRVLTLTNGECMVLLQRRVQ